MTIGWAIYSFTLKLNVHRHGKIWYSDKISRTRRSKTVGSFSGPFSINQEDALSYMLFNLGQPPICYLISMEVDDPVLKF